MMKKRIAAGIAALLMTFAAAPVPEIAEFLPLAEPITAQAATYTVYSNDRLLTATLDTTKMTILLVPTSSYFSSSTSATSLSFNFSGYKTELFNSLKAKDSSVDLSKCKVILNPPSSTYFSTTVKNLESVTFNDGFINEVGTSMFSACAKLKYATFGSSITSSYFSENIASNYNYDRALIITCDRSDDSTPVLDSIRMCGRANSPDTGVTPPGPEDSGSRSS